tara:strand:- start:11846 stop:12034 length:189 start_codon:yes stop_codon:yes gene_type:complete
MKTYTLLKDWQFSASKLIKEGRKAVINDVLAKELMKDGYIENPNKKTKKIKKDGGANSTTDN